MAAASVALALFMVALDEHYRDDVLQQQGWIFPKGARAVLSTIAGSIITVAGTTFSITIAALSLASAQFGPRLLRNFMRDTGNQVVLGTFTSTFLYCVLVLRTVRGLEDNTYVPHISVTVGVLLAVLSLGVLISSFITLRSQFRSGTSSTWLPRNSTPRSCACFQREGGRQPGAKNRRSTHLRESRELNEAEQSAIRAAFTFGRARTPQQDAVFAFLQLSEIALRALSPSVNDPFTAIMCIDRITSAMAQLAHRSLPDPVRCDSSGHPRMIAHPYTYDDLVQAAYRHIREGASGHWQVCTHLQRQIEYVAAHAYDSRLRVALTKELEAIAAMRADQD